MKENTRNATMRKSTKQLILNNVRTSIWCVIKESIKNKHVDRVEYSPTSIASNSHPKALGLLNQDLGTDRIHSARSCDDARRAISDARVL